MSPIFHTLLEIARQFDLSGEVVSVTPHGSGNVNDTFLITTNAVSENKAILQRINPHVFKLPKLIIENMRTTGAHISSKLSAPKQIASNRWEFPGIIRTKAGSPFFLDDQGEYWRAIEYIDKTLTFDTIENTQQAEQVGIALGIFHRLLFDLEPSTLHETLPGFHITPRYLEHFDQVRAETAIRDRSKITSHNLFAKVPKALDILQTECELIFEPTLSKELGELKYCLAFVVDRRHIVDILESARQKKQITQQAIHGDPKLNNFLFDKLTSKAVGLIDLDTIQPGLLLHDISDCLRSCCNLEGEETTHPEKIRFDIEICQAILNGYFGEMKELLTKNDRALIFNAVQLISFELGLRFLTDFLEGDVYFKTNHPQHNLQRALVQFKLTESIEAQEAAIRGISTQG